MIARLTAPLLYWLPADSRQGVQQRAVIVAAVGCLIAIAQWLARPGMHGLDASLVYTLGISMSTWFFSDPLRIALHRQLGAAAPHYWAPSLRTALYLLVCIALGYVLGTSLGDAYIGRSTWELLMLSPQRFWGFALTSLGISLAFLFYFSQRERARDLQRQATEARLKLLESQLEPHMLFNTLANLRVLIATDPQQAIEMLDRLNDFLRATLQAPRSDSNGSDHTLADEFARLEDYLALMAVRMGPRLQFELQLPEALRRHTVPPLLLQPLVENAIRHGLEPKVGKGHIEVSASRQADQLILVVTDTGAGMPSDANGLGATRSRAGGFGLAQVRERVAGWSNGSGSVEVRSEPDNGTSVRVALPFTLKV